MRPIAALGKGQGDRIKTPILVSFAMVLACIVGAFVATSHLLEGRRLAGALADRLSMVDELVYEDITSGAETMRALIDAITADARIQDAFRARDRDGLLALAHPMFERIRNDYRDITHMYFIDPNRVTVLRVHKPDLFGDVIDRFTTRKAHDTGEAARGIELGPLGTLTLRTIVPWKEDGRVLGFVELGQEIDHVAKRIRKAAGVEVVVTIYKTFLDETTWRQGIEMLNRSARDWDRFGSSLVVGSTLTVIPEIFNELLGNRGHGHMVPTRGVSADGRELQFGFLPLFDAADREIGDFVLIQDVTATVREFRHTMTVIVGLSLMAGILVFSLFYVILGRVEGSVQAVHRNLEKLVGERTRALTAEVAERRSKEEALLGSESRFRAMTESAVDAIISVDAAGNIVFWNRGAQAVFGYPEAEVSGRSLTLLMPERFREAHTRGMACAAATGTGRVIGRTVELTGLRKDGSEFPLEITISTWTAEEKRFFTAIVHDITSRKITENEIRQHVDSLEIISTILRLALGPLSLGEILGRTLELLFSHRNLGVEAKGCIFLADSASGELMMAAHKGLADEVIALCSRVPVGRCLCGRAAESGKGVHTAHVDARHDIAYSGMPDHGHYCTPIVIDERVVGVLNLYVPAGHECTSAEERLISAVADTLAGIIRRRQVEEEVERYQTDLERMVDERTADLSHAYEELRSFAYIVSHDLRSPLVSIKGFAGELRFGQVRLREVLDPVIHSLTDERRAEAEAVIAGNFEEAIDFIEVAASKMDRLIRSILQLSRLGRRPVMVEPVDVRAVVVENVKALGYQIGGGGVDVVIGELPTVLADRLALEQIFGNLLSNAVKFLDSGRPGRIAVNAGRVTNATVFHVEDNGRGIPAHELPRIFEIFFRGAAAETPGDGMGLTYVQTLVRRLGGRIWCDSEPGVGTTFSFSISDDPASAKPVMAN